ncbi:MAG: septum formation inhibitor Maf [Acidobacteriota bacterium]|nr:septum formation inhibitor Maf [Acidobacteriota bacterium]
MRLVLASASPRRAEILRNAGIPFEIRTALIDESPRQGELPSAYVQRLALEKARAAADAASEERLETGTIFMGADTTVVIDDEMLGKPESEEDAQRMLRRLSGRVHEVHTGLALVRRPGAWDQVVDEVTAVTFANLSGVEIERYVATGEPFGKAGGYAVQGIAGRFITRIDGCYFNVVGLPLARLYSLLREAGWKIGSVEIGA